MRICNGWVTMRGSVNEPRHEPDSERCGSTDQTASFETDLHAHTRLGVHEFKALAETIPGLVFVTDHNGDNIYANIQFARFAGVTVEALAGNGWLDVMHPKDRDAARKIWSESVRSGVVYDTRCRMRRFDGEYHWHVVRSSPLMNAQGEIVRWMGVCTDIDDLLTSIDTKTNAEGILAALGKGSGLILYAKDLEGRFVYANEATIETIGLPVDQIIGRSAEELAPGSEQAAAIRQHDECARISATGITVEESWLGPDGEMRFYRSRKARFRLSDGRPGLAAATVEITQEKELAEAVRCVRGRYSNWLNTVPIASFEADGDGNVIAVNQRWIDTCGISIADIEHTLNDLVIPECQPAFEAAWAASLHHHQPLEIDIDIYDHFERRVRKSHVVALPGSMLEYPDSDRWYGSFS